MPIYGKTDNLAGAPKNITRKAFFNSASASIVDVTNNTINLVPSNTGFNTGDQVLYNINGGTVITGLVNNTNYFVRVVGAGLIELYDTYANAIASPAITGRLDITALGVGTQTLQRTGLANPKDSDRRGLVFVSREESLIAGNRAKGLVSPGWWLYTTYTDGNSRTRHKSELLIAIDVANAVSGDTGTSGTSDDTIVADA